MIEAAISFLWILFLAILAKKNVLWSALAILAALPLFLIRLSIFGIPTTTLELGIYTVVIVWGAKRVCGDPIPTSDVGIGSPHLWKEFFHSFRWPLILWLGMTFVSSLYAPDRETSFGILKGWFLDPILLFIVMYDCVRRKLITSQQIVAAFGTGALSIAAFGLIDLFTTIGKVKIPGRLDSFFESANYVSLYLGPVFVMLAALVWKNSREWPWKKRAVSAAAALIILVALLLTKSFGGWIATSAGIGALLLLGPENKKARRVGWAGIGLLLLALTIYGSTIGFRHYNPLFKITSLDTRRDLLVGAKGLILEQPVFGHGLASFRAEFPSYVKEHKNQFPHYVDLHNALWPHNVYLAIWVESGVIALIGFLWLLLLTLFDGLRSYFKTRSWVTLAGLASLITVAVHGLIDTPYFKNDLSILFWMIFLFCAIKEES